MNLARLEEKIIQLINQYSINGNLVDNTRNADYLLRIRNLIDTCQKELANEFPIVKEYTWTHVPVANPTDFSEQALPNKFEKLISFNLKKYPYFESIDYKIDGENILFSPFLNGELILKYQKMPDDILPNADEEIELEIGIKYQELIPYYVAGWVYIEDNATIATMLLNSYETKKSKLIYVNPVSSIPIQDVYRDCL
jgi:hypothetical protein